MRTQHQRAWDRAGEYSAERLKELKKNTLRYAAPRPSEPAAAGVFKLSGSFKPAGAPAAAAAAVTAVLPVGTPVFRLDVFRGALTSAPLLATAVPSALPCTPLSAPTVGLARARRGSKTRSCRRRRARRQAGAAARPQGPPMRRAGGPGLLWVWGRGPRLWTTTMTTSRSPTRRRSGAARSCRTAWLQLCIPAICAVWSGCCAVAKVSEGGHRGALARALALRRPAFWRPPTGARCRHAARTGAVPSALAVLRQSRAAAAPERPA